MAFLGVKELKELQKNHKVIEPYEENRIKNGAYELSLGSEVFLTDSIDKRVEYLNPDTNREVDINPGQFALLLTKEKVKIPTDKIAFISIKAGEKLKGLINISGFHVDPGFHDHLLFSVYNAGPSTIVLNNNEPCFLIWLAELKSKLEEEDKYNEVNHHYGKLSHIPTKYIEFLKRGELTSPKALFDKIEEVETSLNEKIIKSDEKKDRNDWLFKIMIGLFIAIGLKLFWDWSAYDRGYDDCMKDKDIIKQIKDQTNHPAIDCIISHKVDSILNERIQNDTTKY